MFLRLLLALTLAWPAGVSTALAGAVAAAPAAARPLPRFNADPAQMQQAYALAKTRITSALNAIAAVPAGGRNFANTVSALETAYADFNAAVVPLSFLANVSPDEAARQQANALQTEAAALLVDLSMREDVYQAVREAGAAGESLSAEDRRLLERTLRDYKRSGLGLQGKRRERFAAIQKRLSALSIEFDENLKHKEPLEVVRDQLDGLPADLVKELPAAGEDRVQVGLDYPTYQAFMENAKNPTLRQALESRFNSQAKEKNLPLLHAALELRKELAELLGYKTYAHYAIEPRMAKTPERVQEFVNRLKSLLAPGVEADKEELLAVKRQDQPSADRLYAWDVTGMIGQQLGYAINELNKRRYGLDPKEVQQYFPVDRVVSGTLELYQELFGVKFVEVPAADLQEGETWHPDVKLYEIRNPQTGERIAYFYLDLHPREGKYGHAAAFSIVDGRETPEGYRLPAAAMVANFTKPTQDKPSLLDHSEVGTFLHELGHILHHTLSRARYASLGGFGTTLDFVELPSQMLEELAWEPEVVARLSGHWQDPNRKLPKDLFDKMLEAKKTAGALEMIRVLALSAADLAYHTIDLLDTGRALARVFTEFGYIPPTPGTRFEARWGHLMNGYGAGYYGYPWSKVYAKAVWKKIKSRGVLNPLTWLEYLAKVIRPGAGKDENELLRDFLGEDPTEDALLEDLGLSGAGAKSA